MTALLDQFGSEGLFSSSDSWKPVVTDNLIPTDEPARGAAPGRKHAVIAIIALSGIFAHLGLRYTVSPQSESWMGVDRQTLPLVLTLLLGGLPLVLDLLIDLVRREFGSDLLAGISIVTSVFL